MKFVLELKNKPKKDDILVFNGLSFECVSKESLIKEIKLDNQSLHLILNKWIEETTRLYKEIRLLKGEE